MIITEKKKTLSKETKQTYNSKNNPKPKEKKKGVFSTGIGLRNRTSYLLVADQAL